MIKPWGLTGLSEKDTLQLAGANRLIQATLTILRVAEATGTPWILENPLSSLFWRLPQVVQMLKKGTHLSPTFTCVGMARPGGRQPGCSALASEIPRRSQ